MDLKKLVIGTLAGAVVSFLLGKLVYGHLLYHFMGQNPGQIGHIGRREAIFLYQAISHIVFAALLTYVILKSNVSTVVGGLTTGACIGLLLRVSEDTMLYGATIVLSKKGMAADVIALTVIAALMGAVIGAVAGGKPRS